MTTDDKSRILVVEDESHIAFGIKFNLEAEGFEVAIAEDGPTALKLVDETQCGFDMIVLDVMLPGMSGYAVCRTLRDAGHTVPVLILSARSLSEDRSLGFDAGANQYLTKPFELDELISRVKNLLAMSKTIASEKLQSNGSLKSYEFGNARINFETYEVFVNDELVRLTPMQLNLLRHFIENAGRVVSRQELLENVWKQPGSINTRTLDQFLRQLRKAFEPEPSRPRHFLTIRDVGYRFVPEPDETNASAGSESSEGGE